MAEQTWNEIELPILEVVRSLETEVDDYTDINADLVVDRAGFDRVVILRTLLHLANADFLDLRDSSTMEDRDYYGIMLTEKGRRAVGQWPPEDSYESLVMFLQTLIVQEGDVVRRSRLEGLRDALTDVGKNVAGSLLAAWLRQQAGI